MSSVQVQRMPSTPLAPREFSDDSLIANKLSSELDKKFISSSKQVLLQRIEFKAATKPDEQYEKLKKKYPPLNATNGLNVQHYRNGSISAGEVGADEDIPAPKVVLYSAENLQLGWKSVRRIGPGLSNMGNTCFLNSVLQVLTYTAPLVNYLSTGAGHCKECRAVGFCMLCELQRHIVRTFSHHQNETIKPMAIINKLKLIARHFKFGHQEDAHEFLRYVVEGMQKSCLPSDMEKKLDRYSKETSLVHSIFGGYYRSQVRCLKCHNTSNTFDPLMEIMLDIKHAPSVTKALQRSIKIELLDGENLYQCPRCKKKVPAHKQVLIHRTPNVLTIHLKRFDYNSMFGGKISKEVGYSEQLDLRPFMTTKGPPVMYRLYAVLVHSGHSCNSGHYYCYVRASNGTWYSMNDSMVRQAGLKAVLSQQAYLLFYTKVSKEEPKLSKSLLRQTSLNIPTTPPSATTPNTPRIIRENDHGTPVSKSKSGIFIKTTPKSTSTITKSTATPSSSFNSPSSLAPSSERQKLSFCIPLKSKVELNKFGPGNTSAKKSESANVETAVSSSPDLSKKPGTLGSTRDRSTDQVSAVVQAKESPTSVPAESFPLRKEDTGKSPSPKKPRPPPLFIPRAVGQVRRRPSKDSLPHTTEEGKKVTTPNATTPWKVTPRLSTEPFFGPMSPPPSGTVLPQHSPLSARSDISSSTSSIMGKSGEWTVSSKMDSTPGPRLPERQHAGWQVREKCGKDNDDLKEEKTSSEDEEKEKRNKKKRKKEKRKKKGRKDKKYHKLEDSGSEVVDEEETKKEKSKKKKSKKKKKKRKSKKQSTDSDSSPSDLIKDEERKTLLGEESSASKKKRKRKNEDDDNEKSKRHRLVDYSDGSSSEGASDPEGGSSGGKKSNDNNGGVQTKKNTAPVPVVHDGESSARGARKMTWDGSRDSSVVKELLLSGGGLKGYGSSVASWEGGQSVVDSHHNGEAGDLERKRRDSDDEWNEAIDRGKVKKVKTKNSDEKMQQRNGNPFQRIHDRKSGKEESTDRSKPFSKHNRHYRTHFKRHKSHSTKGYRKL